MRCSYNTNSLMGTPQKYSSGELAAKQYYIHKSYVNSYYHIYKYIEKWFTSNIFRNESSRVFLASDEYCFRRRFELTDTSKNFDTLEFESLRFPFANYWPLNTGWKADSRFAANPAPLVYEGIYVGNTRVRAASGVMDVPITIWFDREDDARFAYDKLYFFSFNEHNDSVNVPYGRSDTLNNDGTFSQNTNVLGLPVVLEIKDLQFNPQFKETDWLKKQRVFVIKCTVQMRSYLIYPPDQPDEELDLNPDGTLSDGGVYEDGTSFYYIVDDVILNLSNGENTKVQTFDAGYNPDTFEYCGTKHFPEVGERGVVYVDSHCEPEDLGKNRPITMYVWDEVNERYIVPEYELDCHSIRYNGTYQPSMLDITKLDYITRVTPFDNEISWSYGENLSPDDIERIELHLYNYKDITTIDPQSLSYKLEGLKSNSQYYGYILFISKDGDSKKFVINFVTPMSKEDEQKRQGTLNSLVGITW